MSKVAETKSAKSNTAPDSETRAKAAPPAPEISKQDEPAGVTLEDLALEAMGVCCIEDDDNRTLTALDALVSQLEILRLAMASDADTRPFGKEFEHVVDQLVYRARAIREIAAEQTEPSSKAVTS